MKVSDVDIEIIKKLLQSVPDGMEIESINLTDGYSLKLTAGLKELSDVEIQEALEELNELIQDYKKNEKSLSLTKKGCQSLDTPEKN